jgi:two-component system LytT family sensor kinase
MEQQLVTPLLKLAVAAALASILARAGVFKRTLLREERTLHQRLMLAFSLAAIYGAGVGARVITGTYRAVDLGLEGSLVAGILGGYVTGLVGGVLISIPAMLNGEFLSMPLFAGAGVLGGLLRDSAPGPEEIWRTPPFPDLSLWRLIRLRGDHKRAFFHLCFLLAILFAELVRLAAGSTGAGLIFTLYPAAADARPLEILAIFATTLFSVTLPLKIWNHARVEQQLEAQQRLLNEARLNALTAQINPHFLFNTLNTVASLVRTDPDQARAVVGKLAGILRKLLRKHDNFTSLREELAFIEDYLSIEQARFGNKLRFVREIDAETLDLQVPSMLLQPLVENSLKHGLAGKLEGGTIRLQGRVISGRLHLLVEDDGVGISEARLARLFEQGIGVNNVNERLKVLFGSDYKMWIDSKPGGGTRTGIEIPMLEPSLAEAS